MCTTGRPSHDLADWGVPVAVGEWSWPNRQERKEVRFAARSGRYVIWRRVEAWGWYTRQADQSWPGFANANEVGVYPPPSAALSPVDSDSDGLADFREDRDGDGLVGADDTDPHNPDTNQDGRLDGEERAGWPELWDKFYGCTNKWDYTAPTEGRHPQFPDTTVRMQWNHWGRSWMDVDCSYHECLPPDPPPEFVVGQRCERRWTDLSCNYGTERIWFTNHAGQVPGGDPMSYFALFPIPRERCVPFIGNELVLESAILDPPMTFTVRRSAWTDVRLSVGQSTWPKPRRSVVVRLTAVDKTDGQSPGAGDTGCGSNEPNSHWLGREIDPVTQRYEVNDRPVDAEGRALLQVPRGTRDYKLQPQIGCQWYQFEALAESPQVVRLSWSAHPLLATVPDVQAKFDEGARLLADDDDERIRDNDPRLNDPNLRIEDDVPTYLEFIVIKARQGVFPPPFNDAKCLDIRTEQDLLALLLARFANIKLVKSLFTGPGGQTCPFLTNSSMVLAAPGLTGMVAVHEAGHLAGLEHRGSPSNPGNPNDARALMFSPATHPDPDSPGTGNEVNRSEREAFKNWGPTFYNQFNNP